MKQNRDKNSSRTHQELIKSLFESKTERQKQQTKNFFFFLERESKNQLISLITQQKKMNAFVRQKKRHTRKR